jgi:hypothetical protein
LVIGTVLAQPRVSRIRRILTTRVDKFISIFSCELVCLTVGASGAAVAGAGVD